MVVLFDNVLGLEYPNMQVVIDQSEQSEGT